MSDFVDQVNAVARRVGRKSIPAGDGRTIVLSRVYDAGVDDVWDAVSSGERISRWLLPVSGDLRPGGRYQLKDNASGEVLECEPPRRLKVTWVFGANPTERDVSEVEVRLEPVDGGTRLVLEHAAVVPEEMWDQFGPGAAGVGWDLSLIGLGRHLAGAEFDVLTWEETPEARAAAASSVEAWGAASRAAGEPEETVARQVAATRSFYLP